MPSLPRRQSHFRTEHTEERTFAVLPSDQPRLYSLDLPQIYSGT